MSVYSIVLDVLAIAIVAGILFVFVKKGFLHSVLKSCRYLFAAIFAFRFGTPLGDYLDKNFVYPQVRELLRDRLYLLLQNLGDSIDAEGIVKALPSFVVNMFHITPESLRQTITDGLSAQEASEVASTNLAETISPTVSVIIAFFAIFVAVSLAVRLLSHLSGLITSLPGIHIADKILGVILGVILAYLAIVVYVNLAHALFVFLTGKIEGFDGTAEFAKTFITQKLYNWDVFNFLRYAGGKG